MESSPTETLQPDRQAPSSLAIWVQAARPGTLWAAFSPVLVGVAMAVADGVLHVFSALLALVGAVLIQIGTNFYNDYADFEQGADTQDRKGPRRVTQAGWVTPTGMKRATALAFALAVFSGGYLIWRGGLPVVLIGVSAIFFGIWYTAGRYSLAYLGIADLFVLIFFGPVAVGGTYYVQALQLNAVVPVAGLAPGLLSVAILLVNNIRDREEDLHAGKKTLVVRLGRDIAVRLYGVVVVLALLVPVGLYLYSTDHPWSMATVLLLPVGIRLAMQIAGAADASALNPLLGATARLLLYYCLVFSVGWIV